MFKKLLRKLRHTEALGSGQKLPGDYPSLAKEPIYQRLLSGTLPVLRFDPQHLERIVKDDTQLLPLVVAQDSAFISALARRYELPEGIVGFLLQKDLQIYKQLLLGKLVASRVETYAARAITRLQVHEKNARVLTAMVHDFAVPTRAYFDVGCLFGLSFGPAIGLGFQRVEGCEIDDKAFDRAHVIVDIFKQEHPEIICNYFEGDFCALPLPENEYTLMVVNNVLEHTPDVRETLSVIARSLAQDGTCYVYQGNGASLQIVRTEPHYRLPALSLLDNDLAADILIRMGRIRSREEYVVRQWPGYEELIRLAADAGLSATFYEESLGYWSNAQILSREQMHSYARAIRTETEAAIYPHLSPQEREIVEHALESHLARVLGDDSPAAALRYGKSSWDIVLRRLPAESDHRA